MNPTAENIAAFIYEQLKQIETKTAKVCEVEVWESEFSSAVISM
ncbi:MAG: 6-carboxytetrahydropterin synthase [Endomicrobium sp.]|nr:6-carboxytetrahydropterin synthase [Endomicrobium sp.]